MILIVDLQEVLVVQTKNPTAKRKYPWLQIYIFH